MLQNFRLVLGTSLDTLTKTFVGNQFLIWLMYCNLIINSYTQSILASIMTVSNNEPELNTIRDVIQSKQKVLILDNFKAEAIEVLKATGQTELISKFVPYPDSMIAQFTQKLDPRTMPKEVYATWNYDRLELAVILKPTLHMVREQLIPKYQAFQVVTNSPYHDILNKYILWILEAGLYDMWKRLNLHNIVLKLQGPAVDEENIHGIKLTLRHLKVPLYILLIGLSISFIVFLIEIAYSYFANKIKYKFPYYH